MTIKCCINLQTNTVHSDACMITYCKANVVLQLLNLDDFAKINKSIKKKQTIK